MPQLQALTRLLELRRLQSGQKNYAARGHMQPTMRIARRCAALLLPLALSQTDTLTDIALYNACQIRDPPSNSLCVHFVVQ